MSKTWGDHLDSVTNPLPLAGRPSVAQAIPCLTVLAHPDIDRVGEVAPLPTLVKTGIVELSRLVPEFTPMTVGMPRPLADPGLSRRPLVLERDTKNQLTIRLDRHPGEVVVDGKPLSDRIPIDPTRLKDGVIMLLARRVVLLLHYHLPQARRPPSYGMVGESVGMLEVRGAIKRLAPQPWSVLVRGESGTGKELVARALHSASTRSQAPFVTVNTAAIPPTLAAAEFFGASAGAYSDARRDRDGYFSRAEGGMLFLDEIGSIPAEIQPSLLRVLENGEIQPVGSGSSQKVDVRVVSATDIDLEQKMVEGNFPQSLFFRLAGGEIEIPPLRRRRDDIGRLLVFFLREELATIGASRRLEDSAYPWLGADLVAHLARHTWPGNVRELRNLVRTLVAENADKPMATLPTSFKKRWTTTDKLSSDLDEGIEVAPRKQGYRNPATVDDDELLACWLRHRYNAKATAIDLGVSRTSLYALINKHPKIRTAADLEPEEVRQALNAAKGDLASAAQQLEVSERSFKKRLSQLDDGPDSATSR